MSDDALPGPHLRRLKSMGQLLDPVVHLGKGGLTEALLASVNLALADHELIASRRAALGQALAVVDGGEADDEAVNAVMRAVNDLRLVIGTKLDVSEDHDEPPSPDDAEATELWVAYHVLGAILTDTIAALRASL